MRFFFYVMASRLRWNENSSSNELVPGSKFPANSDENGR